jgi:arylesterase/paraoxonase
MRALKKLLAAIGVLVLLVTAGSVALLARGGAFRSIEPHFAGECSALPLDGSAEDIALDRERGYAYLSYMDRMRKVRGEDVQGTVMRIDLNQEPFTLHPALASMPAQLRPHGLSLHVTADGQRWLFAINHGANRSVDPEAVEIFEETSPGEFTHRDTIRDPLLLSPNDLHAVGPRQFYVANDKVAGGGLAGALQQLGIGASPITWFDGSSARYVATDIASGGGINGSADGTSLYVSETAGQRLRVFARASTGELLERSRVDLPTSPDNVDVAGDGSLWITGHASTFALIRHFINGSPAPTQVLRLALDAEASGTAEEIYLDDGQQMSAGSIGATWNDLLLIGSITAKQLLVCRL